MGTPKAVLTDIEGTTSSISFVHEVLFPYAAKALPNYLRAHASEHEDILRASREEATEPDADIERVIEIMLDWIARDRKVTALKDLQGHIWTAGYLSGAFKGHIYEDAVAGLRRWHSKGIRLFVYSSGSVKAQKLLFGHSESGDLNPLFSGYFDTSSGHKRESSSYRNIAGAIGEASEEIVFLSDVVEELDAAGEAGFATVQLVRTEGMKTGAHPTARSFGELDF
ncbi:MAG: acireductone synthase [Myxococcota bacterium]